MFINSVTASKKNTQYIIQRNTEESHRKQWEKEIIPYDSVARVENRKLRTRNSFFCISKNQMKLMQIISQQQKFNTEKEIKLLRRVEAGHESQLRLNLKLKALRIIGAVFLWGWLLGEGQSFVLIGHMTLSSLCMDSS